MINFFYDSLETLQSIKFPTQKDYINLTVSVLVTVVIAWWLFIFLDSVFSGLYRFAATSTLDTNKGSISSSWFIHSNNSGKIDTGTSTTDKKSKKFGTGN